ncbi:MAG: AtpZ/AtpI family protein [Rhodobacteraceae bacterium]|nr:AtpZ/AtpI family protein [Paracoccaceae bacterium]
MSDAPDPSKLQKLEARINAAKAVKEPERRHHDHHSAAGAAWRMVIELVVGMGIGFGIGYGLDRLFGTIPIFLILFTLLGFAAGIRTMMRTAAEIQEQNARAEQDAKAKDQ